MFEKTKYPQDLIFGKYNEALIERLMCEKSTHHLVKDNDISNLDMVLNHVIHEQVKHKHFRWIVIHRFLSSIYQSHLLGQVLTYGRFVRMGVIICMEEIFNLPPFAHHNISHFLFPRILGVHICLIFGHVILVK